MKQLVHRVLRAFGYDLTPSPVPSWVVLRDHTRRLFDRLRINCVLDVGAHAGEYGVFLRRSGYEGWIVSFEPVASQFERLRSRAAGDPRWRVLPFALGRADGEQTIQVAADSMFSSFLPSSAVSARTFGEASRVVRSEVVDVRRLDTMFDGCVALVPDPRVFLKIDTQGYDLVVLEGAVSSLPKVLALQSEVSVSAIYDGTVGYLEAIARMTDMGFEVSAMVPVNTQADGVTALEFDCVMVRQGLVSGGGGR